MADKRISELNAITGGNTANDDLFLVVDSSTGETKKITRAELNNAIEQDVLASVDITTANIDGGTIDGTTIGGTTAAAGSFTTLDTSGNATIGGDLTVNGTTTTINSTTLDVDDLNITLASGAADAASANGAGLTVDGASATFTYASAGDKWTLNKDLDVSGQVVASGSLTVGTDNLIVNSTGIGIGASPQKGIHLNENDSEAVILIQSSDTGTAGVYMGDQSDSIVGGIVYDNNTDTLQLRSSNNHTAVTIDSSERVGIGTTLPIYDLQIGTYGSDADSTLALASTTTGTGSIRFGDGTSGGEANAGKIVYDHSNNGMQFHTVASERMRILSGGGITFNGDTSTANALDDYEEGTFTPVFSRSTNVSPTPTYSTQEGTYVKIGKMVLAEIEIRFSNAFSGGSGNFQVSGLPFTASAQLQGVSNGLMTVFTNDYNFANTYMYVTGTSIIMSNQLNLKANTNTQYLTFTVMYSTN